MTPTTREPKLTGIVEARDTYAVGKPRQRSLSERRERWKDMTRTGGKRMPRRSGPKVPVVAIAQRGGKAWASVMPVVAATNVREMLLD